MYCPRCSQEQVADEMRFCSRCGFPISGVRDLIANNGAIEGPSRSLPGSARRGVWMMLISLVVALFLLLPIAVDDDFAVFLILPFLLFVVGFLSTLYGVFLAGRRKRRSAASAAQVEQLGAGVSRPELSAPMSVPVERLSAQKAQTAEMVGPPSVTENTTKLLDQTEPHRR